MLRKRLITVLTLNDGVLFRTRNFIPDYRYTINLVDAWSVDEIVILDITRPGEGERENFFNVVGEFAKKCYVPLAVGGGVRSVEDFTLFLRSGADKVVINSEAVKNPQIITQAAKLFGSQCVVVSIDVRQDEHGKYEVYTSYGTQSTGMAPDVWARQAQNLGAGEILINSIDRDGMLEGYDNTLNLMVSKAVEIPTLVCGGAGKWGDFVEGFVQGGASAVCTTNIYHFAEASIRSAKMYLQKSGIDVRT